MHLRTGAHPGQPAVKFPAASGGLRSGSHDRGAGGGRPTPGTPHSNLTSVQFVGGIQRFHRRATSDIEEAA